MNRLILCNGSPKTGTHLLQRVTQLFDTVPAHMARHDHRPYGSLVEPAFDKHLHIIRSPRNTAVSWARFHYNRVNRQTLKESIEYVVGEMPKYFGWVDDPSCHTVRFEDLLTDPLCLQGIADYLGLPLSVNHFEKLWGGTQTFTGDLSLWQNYQGMGFEAMWITAGGPILEQALGYDPHRRQTREVPKHG